MFAVIETGGKQYKVQYGDVIFVEKLDAAENDTVEFPVVALFGEGETKVGTPYVEGATVTGKVVKNGKAKKITVFTYKPRRIPSGRSATGSPTPRCRSKLSRPK